MPEILDQLRATVAAASTPTERAHALNQLAEELEKHGQYAESLAAAEEAYSLAKNTGELAIKAEALRLQGEVHSRRESYSTALLLLEQSLKLCEELGDRSSAARLTNNIGNVYCLLSDYGKALEYFSRTLALHEGLGDRLGVAHTTLVIGNMYAMLSDYPKAFEYYTRSLALHEELGDRLGVANTTVNIGLVSCFLSDYPKALEYSIHGLALHEEFGDRVGIANATGNIGLVYYNLSEYGKSLEYYTRGLAVHEELGNRSGIAAVTQAIGALYAQKAFAGYNPTTAEELLLQAITINEEISMKYQLYHAYQALANLYEQQGRWKEALQQFKNYHETYQEVQSEEAKKKALQVEQQRQIAEMEKRTAAERARAKATEELLHKTLPPSIADRMISGEQHIADRFDSASVLFADVVGFTPMTARMPASAVLEFMNFVFAHFDSIAAKHGCERIKTIGDGYMAVCGAPIACEDHAERIARMAMEMLEDITLPESITEHLPLGAEFEIRIGLHCGSITAGVIGTGKLAYDIYGDAVNTASRMESHGEAGKIHVSEVFAEALFGSIQPSSVPSPITTHQVPITLAERGVLEIKGKGQLRTYFLTGA